ncbi:release factor glutamine methyltransferase [Nematocida minor]|uniref:release factor glutamine methyltransferase n=1 Tax=Nematocida minor TaxID=1912983 RepID=UPI00221E43E7|nr:release factor glutamine methyltransferase [Nematocida minor]KAI5190286.1 release factor glutamine methyltransferase [Nematocida minor]
MFYPPSEDTYLMEDALRDTSEQDMKCIVEVGSGSGYISNVLRQLYPTSHIISTDINPSAVKETHRVCQGTNTTVLRTSMIEGIKSKIDMAVFNPPYLPSERDHLKGEWIDRSWAGGVDGMEVTNQFLDATAHIRIRYVLLCQYNKPLEVIEKLRKTCTVKVVKHQKILNENLCVIRIEKPV